MPGDPLWINASGGAPAYSANELRQAMSLALMFDGRNVGARRGVRPGGTQLQVSLAGSVISVFGGVACLDPALSTPQGPYWVSIPVTETHALTAADATNPRKDIVILRVYDHDEDASGLRLARSEYIAGVANPAPVEPAIPAGAIRLATIDVPASPGAPVVTNNARFTAAAGGILPVRTQAERDAASAYDGLPIWRMDRDWIEVHDGAAWRVQGMATVAAFADLATAITNPSTGQLAQVTGEALTYRWTGTAWLLAEVLGGNTAATRHRAHYTQTTPYQSMPSLTFQRINFPTNAYTTTDWTTSTVAGGTVFTCARAGAYRFDVAARQATAAAGERALGIAPDGSPGAPYVSQSIGNSAAPAALAVSVEQDFDIGNQVTVYWYNGAAAAAALEATVMCKIRLLGPKAT